MAHDPAARSQGLPETGKKETVRDLSRAVARHSVIFECCSQLDCQVIGRLFSGCLRSGVWACLHELQRIAPEVCVEQYPEAVGG